MTRGYFVLEMKGLLHAAALMSDAYLEGYGKEIIEAFLNNNEERLLDTLRAKMNEKDRTEMDRYICPEWYRITKKSEAKDYIAEYGYVISAEKLKIYNNGKLLITMDKITAKEWLYLIDHLPDIAEFVKTEKNKEGAVCILLEEMQELGAVVGKEDDIPYIIFTKECKENYFRDRFAKVKKMVADMDLDEFSNSDLFTLRDTIQNNWGDMAYEDSMIPFDQFIRTAIPDAKYYIGNIIHLH